MEDMSTIIAAVLSSILTAIGTVFWQNRKTKSACKKNALYVYMNLSQIKADIDKDKKIIDEVDKDNNIRAMAYFNPYDYVHFLCVLSDKLTEKEILTINNFYERVKFLDTYKIYYCNMYTAFKNYSVTYPGANNPYESEYVKSSSEFRNLLNSITNSDLYKYDIIEIISKLKKMKDK